MPARGSTLAGRRVFWIWLTCAAFSGLLIATPPSLREQISSALEWSVYLPVRAVLGWGGRSLAVYQENRRLAREAAQRGLEAASLRDAGRENRALRRLLGMQARSTLRLHAGRVVGRSLDWAGEALWVEVAQPGVAGGAVVSAEGLVGRVSRVREGRLQVQTLRHPETVVSVLDGRSLEQAIARYDPAHPERLVTEEVPLPADFRIGDAIQTSGLGEVFPAGILVGFVVSIETDARSQMKRILIRPSSRRGRIQEVFVLEERPPVGDASDLFQVPARVPERSIGLPGDGEIVP